MSGITTLVIVSAAMVCVLVGVTLLAHIYSLNSIKSKPSGTVSTARRAGRSRLKYEKRISMFLFFQSNGESRLCRGKHRLQTVSRCRRALSSGAPAARATQPQ